MDAATEPPWTGLRRVLQRPTRPAHHVSIKALTERLINLIPPTSPSASPAPGRPASVVQRETDRRFDQPQVRATVEAGALETIGIDFFGLQQLRDRIGQLDSPPAPLPFSSSSKIFGLST